jgi:hypothetical protein
MEPTQQPKPEDIPAREVWLRAFCAALPASVAGTIKRETAEGTPARRAVAAASELADAALERYAARWKRGGGWVAGEKL